MSVDKIHRNHNNNYMYCPTYDYQIRSMSRQRRIKRDRILKRMMISIIISVAISLFFQFNTTEAKIAPQVEVVKVEQIKPTSTPSPTPLEPTIAPKAIEVPIPTQQPLETPPSGNPEVVAEGHVSHYSRAGCLGCDPNFIMANGQPLDDNAMTIAVVPGTLPMGTQVKLTNTSNGKEVIATVTDTGGFAKYGRVADLTLAVGNALETKTDNSIVKIEVFK